MFPCYVTLEYQHCRLGEAGPAGRNAGTDFWAYNVCLSVCFMVQVPVRQNGMYL